MAAVITDDMGPEQLRLLLDDAQATLAASLGRIEAHRIQNKQLVEEVSNLRRCVHGGEGDVDALRQGVSNVPKATKTAEVEDTGQGGEGASTGGPPPPTYPVFVSAVEHGASPIEVVSGGKKEACNLLVTRDAIGMVSTRARIQCSHFVGITSVKPSVSSAMVHNPKPGGLFTCCVANGKQCASDDEEQLPPVEEGRGRWQFVWNKENSVERLLFEASKLTRESLHRHTEKWLGLEDAGEALDSLGGGAGAVVAPQKFPTGLGSLQLAESQASQVLTPDHLEALAGAVPESARLGRWCLSFSTTQHGRSLHTLFRMMQQGRPSLLVVRDGKGAVFGCFTPDSWRASPRYYGQRETFVFQLEPHRMYYPWNKQSEVQTDLFQYSTVNSLGVGGLGTFAIYVNSDLKQGSSGTCGTFGSTCLASKEEFRVDTLEIWQLE